MQIGINSRLVTIDGPSASGKSSVSRSLSRELHWPWISTGAFYRGWALATFERKIDPADEREIVSLIQSGIVKVRMSKEETLVYLGDRDLTQEIKTDHVGQLASAISQLPKVREALLAAQRACFLPERGLIAEGRDCGSVVFPEASCKFYLTADEGQRALRRSMQAGEKISETMRSQAVRDAQDGRRKAAPLRIPDGAEVIDTTHLALPEVVNQILAKVKESLRLSM